MIRTVSTWLIGTIALAQRELLSLFVTPLAYVVATLFLLEQGWNFALLLRFLNDPLAAPGPVMQFYFGGSFFIFWLPVIFICAALSMRLVAEERKQGTLEALLTAPLGPAQVVIGKFAGALGFYVALWSPTAVFYVLLQGAAVAPDAGPILSGYLGTLLVGASFIAIGLLMSALARTQLGAALATFVTCTIALLAGLLVDQVETETLASVLERTSLLAMMQELAQGIVDSRWIYLHGTIVVAALAVTIVIIDPRRTFERGVRAVLVVVCAANVGAVGARHGDRGDWTGGDVYTLSERAREVLTSLDKPVDVTVVVPATIGGGRANPLAQELREVLQRMAKAGPALRVRIVDPDRERQEAEQLVVDFGIGGRDLADGVVLIRAGQGAALRRAHLLPSELVTYATGPDVQITGPRVKEFRGEEALLSRFLEVTQSRRTRVCLSQGHGEPALDNLEPYAGYAHLSDLLAQANLETTMADLDAPGGLSDCDVLLVGGPRGRLPSIHVEAIERFAEGGGDLLFLTGAVLLRGRRGLVPNGLEPVAARYGITFGDRVVVDPHGMPGGTPMIAFTLEDGWGDHASVTTLVGRPISLVFARELVLEEPGPAVALVSTSEAGWAESDVDGFSAGNPPVLDEAADQPGPITVAAASELGGARLVVIGSDQFALNAYLREDVVYDHGRDLILNAIGWLADDRALLGIRARAREHVKLVLLPEQLERMILVCLIGLPGFAIALGGLVLWRRRR